MNLLSKRNRNRARAFLKAESSDADIVDSRLPLFDILNTRRKGIDLSLGWVADESLTQFVTNRSKHQVNKEARFANRIA